MVSCRLFFLGILLLGVLFYQFGGRGAYDVLFLRVGSNLAWLLPEDELLEGEEQGEYDYEDLHQSWAAHPDKLDWYEPGYIKTLKQT